MQKVHQQLISTGGNFIVVLLKSVRAIFFFTEKEISHRTTEATARLNVHQTLTVGPFRRRSESTLQMPAPTEAM